jgi:uncharacterized protein (TIGR00645 family)
MGEHLGQEGQMHDRSTAERWLEEGLFASRWLMAPMYIGLIVTLGMLVVIFMRELVHYAPEIMNMTAEETILLCLTLIDLTLAANLLLIVMFSGYENFVSKIEVGDGKDRPDWMGKVDFSGLKMKLIASIVAISGIHLLKQFMEIGVASAEERVTSGELMWLVVIHLTFVTSGVLMAVMDYLVARSYKTKAE